MDDMFPTPRPKHGLPEVVDDELESTDMATGSLRLRRWIDYVRVAVVANLGTDVSLLDRYMTIRRLHLRVPPRLRPLLGTPLIRTSSTPHQMTYS